MENELKINPENTFADKIAKGLAVIFHPIFMPIYLFSYLLYSHTVYGFIVENKYKLYLLSMIAAFTVALPVLNILLLKQFKVIKSVTMENQSERSLPYFVTAACYFALYYLLRRIDFFVEIQLIVLTGSMALCLSLIINRFWKISAHLIGIGGFTGSILGLSLLNNYNFLTLLIFAFFAAGLLGFARLQLKAHKPAQLYAGFSLGFIMQFGILFIIYWLQTNP